MANKVVNVRPLFNPNGDIDVSKRRMVNGNTTNLNDFNNMKYEWVSKWYRQAMNNFWVPEEVNLSSDLKDYKVLTPYEREAYDKILSFLVFLDSIQTANLPRLSEFITANEVNLCLAIQTYQEAIHSQAYSYMLDSICEPHERDRILYYWKDDKVLLGRNTYIGNIYNEFTTNKSMKSFMRVVVANYVLEGVYFYSGFMFFYNLARNKKMTGSAQEIRYINRDENTHLWLFREIILELRKEHPEMFTKELVNEYRSLIKEGCEQEIKWGHYCIGEKIQGLSGSMITNYIQYLGNLRCRQLDFEKIYDGHDTEPESCKWVTAYSEANDIKTDFFEARSTAYTKSSALVDDL